MAARWPGVIPAGTKFSEPVSALDIMATIAAANGIPEDPARPLDGVNLVPFVRGEQAGVPHERIYLRMFDRGVFAMRNGDFKIVKPKKDASVVLFNVEEDIGESKDLAAAEAERLGTMQKAYGEWDAQLIPPVFEGLQMKAKPKPKAGQPQ
jgi:arylsulfatase A-like enzyme